AARASAASRAAIARRSTARFVWLRNCQAEALWECGSAHLGEARVDERIGIEECGAHMARAFDLHGKVAVITGAGSGIGRSTAMLLARNGAKVHVADIDAERARKVAREIEAAGGSASAHALDVSDPAAVEALA